MVTGNENLCATFVKHAAGLIDKCEVLNVLSVNHEMLSRNIIKVLDLDNSGRYTVRDMSFNFVHSEHDCRMSIHVVCEEGDIIYTHTSRAYNKTFRLPEFMLSYYTYRLFLEVQCQSNRFRCIEYNMENLKVY